MATSKQQSLYTRKKGGFSLIELTLVISIISLIASFAFPSYLQLKIKAARVEMKMNMRAISTLLHTYHADEGNYPSDSAGYGVIPANSDGGLDACTPGGADPNLTDILGHTATECEKLRYYYLYSPGTLSAVFGHPEAPSSNAQKYFLLRALSSYTVDEDSDLEQLGNPPIAPSLCKTSSSSVTSYRDFWFTTEAGVMATLYNSDSYNALKSCL